MCVNCRADSLRPNDNIFHLIVVEFTLRARRVVGDWAEYHALVDELLTGVSGLLSRSASAAREVLLPFDTLILPADNKLKHAVAVHHCKHMPGPRWWHRAMQADGNGAILSMELLPRLIPLSQWPLTPSLPAAAGGFGPRVTVLPASPAQGRWRKSLPSTHITELRQLPWGSQSYGAHASALNVRVCLAPRRLAGCAQLLRRCLRRGCLWSASGYTLGTSLAITPTIPQHTWRKACSVTMTDKRP